MGLRLYDYECEKCGELFEELSGSNEQVLHCDLPARKLLSAPAYIWNCSRGGSTAPRRFNNSEPRRQEEKRERVTGMLDKQGLNEKNNVNFMDPKEARKR